jgi:hypothetical protein
VSVTGAASWAGEDPASYASPQAALDAVIEALASDKEGAILDVFGTNAEDVISTGNPLEDAENAIAFLQMYANGYRFLPESANRVTLLLGEDSWPFPIPLERSQAGWAFDVEDGREEVLARRIGLNELETMELMEAYVAAQSLFRQTDHDGDGVMEFAAGILPSEPGARDGLFWASGDSLMGELIAMASLDGYFDGEEDQEPEPFGGYYYRVLNSQGDAAPGGAMDYIINGNKIAGHALLAVPSDYGNNGIHSFLISENGVLMEADLGEDSLDIAQEITAYNPDDVWTVVD